MTSFSDIYTFISNIKLGDAFDPSEVRRMVLRAIPREKITESVAEAIDDLNGYLLPIEICLMVGDQDGLHQSKQFTLKALNELSKSCQLSPSARLQ